ncbi:MAG: hypothetical protein ACLFWB_11865 [Armatimonadota bacterium]
MEFSEESKLLIEHWETYEEIVEVADQLEDEELPAIREEIMEEILAADWADEWEMRDNNPRKFTMHRPAWMHQEHRVIYIGFSRFRPRRVFGSSGLPKLWVRLSSDYIDELIVPILDSLRERDAILGEINDSSRSRDIITKRVQKCPPEAVDHYAENVKREVMDFFEHYCTVLGELNELIQTKLGEME